MKKIQAPLTLRASTPSAPLSIKKVAAAIAPKKAHHKKSVRRVVHVAKRATKVEAPKEKEVDLSFLDAEFDVADEQETYNLVTPLDQIADAGFAEIDLDSTTVTTQFHAEVNIPQEPRFGEVVAVYQREDFSRINMSLDRLAETSIALDEFLATPEPKVEEKVAETSAPTSPEKAPELVTPTPGQDSLATAKIEAPKSEAVPKDEPTAPKADVSASIAALADKMETRVINSVPVTPAVSAPVAAMRQVSKIETREVENENVSDQTPAEEVTTHVAAIAPGDHVTTREAAAEPTPTPKYEELPISTKEVLAQAIRAGEPSLSLPAKMTMAVPIPIPVLPKPATPGPTISAAPKLGPSPEPTISAPTKSGTTVVAQRAQKFADDEGGTLIGRIEPDTALADWLASVKGHVELYMQPVGSPDPQDTIYVDYQYPNEEFQIDLHGLKGTYRLVAGVFSAKATTAIAQIPYSKPITSASYKEKLGFPLTKVAMDRAASAQMAARSDGQVFNVTLFEGASGNHRQPKPIAGGSLRIIGFPEWGTLTSDKDGNIRIPKVPGRSELLIEVTAKDYLPTFRTIPTFGTNVYVPIYLISRDKVDAVTRYFTKRPQRENASVVMGRIFDPATRAPKKDATVSLSARRGRPMYFGALPDPSLTATSESGLFGFFNVGPTFRSVYRTDKRSLLLNVRPGAGEYVELGRGGRKSLIGKLLDPFNNRIPPAKVKIVGDSKAEYFTDKNGQFKIADIDLPPGTLTLEVQAEGYPTIWHTVPWNTRERETTRSLFMMERELLSETAARVAKLKLDPNHGALIGGADASFFAKGAKCVTVTLLDANGNAVEKATGPFPLVGDAPKSDAKLCLSKAAPGFAYYNLKPGEYILKWTDATGVVIRSHVLYVGMNRVSIAVD